MLDGGTGTDSIVYTATGFASGDVTAGTAEVLTGGAGDRLDFTAAFEAGLSNVRFLAATDVLQIDLNNDGIFTAGSDFQLSMAGVSSVTYNAAGDYFQLA